MVGQLMDKFGCPQSHLREVRLAREKGKIGIVRIQSFQFLS